MSSEISNEDWNNLRCQLKVLVDIYCELNDDIFKIKQLLKKIFISICKKDDAHKIKKALLRKNKK